MKLTPVIEEGSGRIDGYLFACPGCAEIHHIPTDDKKSPYWEFNGGLSRPSFNPLVEFKNEKDKSVCRFYISEGTIYFLPGCTHQLEAHSTELFDI